jgi:hypothetical protein
MSFTGDFKGHTIVSGPKRASRGILHFGRELILTKAEDISLKENIKKRVKIPPKFITQVHHTG